MGSEKINPEQAFMSMMVVWFALVVSQGLFLVLAFFIKPELLRFDFSQPLLGGDAVVIGVLAVVSLSIFAASFVMRKRFITQAIDGQRVELVQTAMIVGCSMCEAVSIIGLFLAVANDYRYFFIFSGLGIVGTALHFPKRNDVQAATFKAFEP